jgi:hypothetical protein
MKKTPLLEIVVLGKNDRYKQVVSHHRLTKSEQASFALDLMRSGMMAGIHDGKDAKGEDVFKLLTPAQLVERAVQISELAYATFATKKWTFELPPFDELKETDEQVGFK